MLSPDHPLAALQAQAALATGWPTLHVYGPSEAAVVEAQDAAVAQLGPLPQADIIAPWDEHDPDEPWELRIDLPGLSADAWPPLRDALAELGWDAGLLPGLTPGARAAGDQMRRECEPLLAHGLVAELWFDAEHGGVVAPELVPHPTDAAIIDLQAEFVQAVRSVRPGLVFRGDRGDDSLASVCDRRTGRRAVVLSFSTDQVDAPHVDVQELRQALWAAIAEVVHARSTHRELRLAPDVLWDTRLGLAFTVWLVCPPAGTLPGDPVVEEGVWPADVEGLAAGTGDIVGSVEVQVVPAGDHDAAVAATGQLIQEGDLDWLGALPRWVRTASGVVFTPVWQAAPQRAAALARAVAALAEHDAVHAVRVVPGEPTGAEELWLTMDPAWWLASARCFVRWRDGVPDRDRLEPAAERERSPDDERLARAILGALKGRGLPLPQGDAPMIGRPIRDPGGRDGLELSFDDERCLDAKGLAKLLAALGRTRAPDVSTVHPVAFRGNTLVVRFWSR